MRAVTVTYMWAGYSPTVVVFSWQYKGLTDEKLIKKVKGWCRSNIYKAYAAEKVSIVLYSDIMDISTAENIPLVECPPGHCPDCFPRSCTCG